MAKVYDFSLTTVAHIELEEFHDRMFRNPDFAMTLSGGPLRDRVVKEGVLYRVEEGRIMMVVNGTANIQLNLEEFHVQHGDIVLGPPNTIIELRSCSSDFDLNGVVLPVDVPVPDLMMIHTTPEEWEELSEMVQLLWRIAHHHPFSIDTVRAMVKAIICNLQDIHKVEEQQNPTNRPSRQEQIFRRFKKLVNQHCARERTLSFYADQLYITPHHLSAVIMKVSGHTAMYWINRAVVLQAKVMLRTSYYMIYEIADRLGFPNQSFFGKFFKRETGISPKEYREG